MDAAKVAKRASSRTFVVMHLFSGASREGDLEHAIRELMMDKGLPLLVISADLGADNNWDLVRPETFHTIHELIVQGFIGAIFGGPPCATWSRLRFRAGGPRPLRFRWGPWTLRPMSMIA